MSDFIHLFEPSFLLRNALWGSVAVGLFCPLIGVYFMLRRMILMGVALPQVSSAGIAFVFFLQGLGIHWSLHPGEPDDRIFALAGSLVFTLIAILALGMMERRGGSTSQSRIGALFAMGFAASILLVSGNPKGEVELLSMLHGEIVSVSANDLWILLAAYVVLSAVLLVFNRQFLLVSFDPDFARSLGKRTTAWDVFLYAIIGFAIAMSVLIVGPMLTFAALVIPPLAVRRFCSSMPGFFAASSIIGGVSGLLGFYLSYHWDVPLGPAGIAVFSVGLIAAVFLKKAMNLKSST